MIYLATWGYDREGAQGTGVFSTPEKAREWLAEQDRIYSVSWSDVDAYRVDDPSYEED